MYKNLFYNNVQPEICQYIKNMLRTYPGLREEQSIFYCFYGFPKRSRKSELHNVLHETRAAHVKFCSSVEVRTRYLILNLGALYSSQQFIMLPSTAPLNDYNSSTNCTPINHLSAPNVRNLK